MTEFSMGTLYDANRQLMSDEKIAKPMNPMELAVAQKKIEDFFNWKCDCYGMLYCRELSDITIFHMYESQNPNPPALAAKECLGCCTDRGIILSIEEQPDGNFEFWIKNNSDDEVHAYYLFPYDLGVIEV